MAYIDDLQVAANNITTSSQNIEFVLLATQITTATNNRCFSVPDINSLPVLTTSTNYPLGQILFVESVGVPVISAANRWIGIDGRTIRKDFISCDLWAWGNNNRGTLGNGTTTRTCSPVREFCSATDWCQISMSSVSYATSAIKTSGQLWSWGCNNQGQLGIGDGASTDRCSPVREFCSATDWCNVQTGCFHTVAIKTSGQIWTWGSNCFGTLGIGSSATIGRCSPVREFCSATDWCQVSAGICFVGAIKTSGQIWTWGNNSSGQLGIGDSATLGRCSPVREFCSATDWCRISAGGTTIAAIKTSGQLWTWGSNSCGQLGIGSSATIGRCSPVREFCSATDWCQVSGGNIFFSALKTSGQIWSWGFNSSGQLGDNTVVAKSSPVREFSSATDWCQISAGNASTGAIKTSGQLWLWGSNTDGTIGDGTLTNRSSPTREQTNDTRWSKISLNRFSTLAIKVI